MKQWTGGEETSPCPPLRGEGISSSLSLKERVRVR